MACEPRDVVQAPRCAQWARCLSLPESLRFPPCSTRVSAVSLLLLKKKPCVLVLPAAGVHVGLSPSWEWPVPLCPRQLDVGDSGLAWASLLNGGKVPRLCFLCDVGDHWCRQLCQPFFIYELRFLHTERRGQSPTGDIAGETGPRCANVAGPKQMRNQGFSESLSPLNFNMAHVL